MAHFMSGFSPRRPGPENAEFFHPRSLRAANGFCYPRSVPAVAQPVALSSVLYTSTDARNCYALGVMHSRSRGILYGMSSDLLHRHRGRGDLCHNRCMGLLLADHMQDIGATKSNAKGAVIQAPYLSPGFSDLETGMMLSHVLGVGCESDDQKGFMGWWTQKRYEWLPIPLSMIAITCGSHERDGVWMSATYLYRKNKVLDVAISANGWLQ